MRSEFFIVATFLPVQVDDKNLNRFESHFGPANTRLQLGRHLIGVFNSQNVDAASNVVC